MIGYSDDARLDDLLAPLRRLEPVTLRGQRARRRWRPVLVAAVAVGALTGAGVAIAAGFGAFDGISAADHSQSPADASPQIPWVRESCANAPFYTDLCHLVPDSSRLVGQLPSGHKIWVVASTRGNLCVVVEGDGASCGSALSSSDPTTFVVENNGTMTRMLVYGVALDGVTSVSFTVRGEAVTVPVRDNVWAYEQPTSAYEIQDLVAHFADGRTVALP